MYKNQLQELAQRSCFNLPSYACSREGPDHAPRFKACVNFNGEVFESPTYRTTLRQAEHAAAEVALKVLSTRGPSRSLTARVLDETGVYKNLLQETAHRAGLKLPVYTIVRSGPGHVPVFTCSVELAGMNFTGESAKTKKQAEKNAAIAAWSALKTRPNLVSLFETSRYAAAENARDQNQAAGRRMIVRGQKDNLQYNHDQQRRLMDLLMLNSSSSAGSGAANLFEVGGGGGSSNSSAYKKQNTSFVSLLPPPKPRTTSKILPPRMVQVKMKEVPASTAMDHEHQRVEDEWLRRSTCSNSCVFNSRRMGFSIPSSTTCNYRQMGGYNNNCPPQRIAPAVQIRSVIPVCAAAPVRPPPHLDVALKLNPPLVKEAARDIVSPSPSSELNSAQLTRVFNDKLQLR